MASNMVCSYISIALGNIDGMDSLVEFKENCGRFELGYRPMRADVKRSALERKGKGMGQQQRPPVKETPPCHISKSFVSAGWRCEWKIAMSHGRLYQSRVKNAFN